MTPMTFPGRKRGPAPKLERMQDTHLHLPPHLVEWAKCTPEGFTALVRRLLSDEYARQHPQPEGSGA